MLYLAYFTTEYFRCKVFLDKYIYIFMDDVNSVVSENDSDLIIMKTIILWCSILYIFFRRNQYEEKTILHLRELNVIQIGI